MTDDLAGIEGTADPAELRHMAEAWPEDIFPTPPESKQAKDAVAAHVLRRLAVPHFLACADEIERLRAALEEAQLRSIEARNPGIDMERVKRERGLIGDDDE